MHNYSRMPPKKESKQAKEQPSCSICCNTLNKSKNKPVSCNFCADEACLECVKHYILDTHGDLHCMFCRNKWNRDIVVEKLPLVFIKEELREHQEKKIVEIEKARLPAAQTIAENRIKLKNIQTFREAVSGLLYSNIDTDIHGKNDSQIELLQLIARNYGIEDDIKLDTNMITVITNLEEKVKTEEVKRNYVRNCPNNSCRGFINEEWNCGLCGTKMCKKCFEQVDNEKSHKCDQNIIESNKLIAKDSKPCPKCNCLITKLSGCDQMFCVSCHTAFSWERGTIEKGVIHNPHFYQWQKTLQATAAPLQTPAVDLCNENYFPSISDLSVYQKAYDSYTEKWLFRFHQFITHLYLAVRPAYLTTSSTDLKMEINVNYMMTAFGKTEWKRRLYDADRRQEMARDMVELIDMVYAISGERFRNFIRERDAQHIKDVGTLLVYTMDEFDKIKKRHMIKSTIFLEQDWLVTLRNSVKSI